MSDKDVLQLLQCQRGVCSCHCYMREVCNSHQVRQVRVTLTALSDMLKYNCFCHVCVTAAVMSDGYVEKILLCQTGICHSCCHVRQTSVIVTVVLNKYVTVTIVSNMCIAVIVISVKYL